MAKIKKEKLRLFILPSILLILILAIFFFLLRPITKQLKENRKILTQKKAKLVEIKKAILEYDGVKEELLQLKKRANFYDAYLPQKEELPSFFNKLTELANETGVKYESLQPLAKNEKKKEGEGKSPSLYKEKNFALRLIAGYHQLGYFINRLERMNRLVEVKEVRMNPGKDIFDEQVRLFISLYLLNKPLIAKTPSSVVTKETFTYGSYNKRDPFIPLVSEESRGIINIREVLGVKISLQAILHSQNKYLAIINNSILSVGEKIPGTKIKITKILDDKVIFSYKFNKYELRLKKRVIFKPIIKGEK